MHRIVGLALIAIGLLMVTNVFTPLTTISSSAPQITSAAFCLTSSYANCGVIAGNGAYTMQQAQAWFTFGITVRSDLSLSLATLSWQQCSSSACGVSSSASASLTNYGYGVWGATVPGPSQTKDTGYFFTLTATDSNAQTTTLTWTLTYININPTFTAYANVNGVDFVTGCYPSSACSITSSLSVKPSDAIIFRLVVTTYAEQVTGTTLTCTAASGTCPLGLSFTKTLPGGNTWQSSSYSFPQGKYTVTGSFTCSGCTSAVTAFSILANTGGGGVLSGGIPINTIVGAAIAILGVVLVVRRERRG